MAGLQRRLLVMLLVPLGLLALGNAWFDYRVAGSAAAQQDQQLQRLVPLVADSVVAAGAKPLDPPVLLLAPAIDDFIKARQGLAAYAISALDGRVLVGESWLSTPTPSTSEPEFHSEVEQGVTYRIVVQRMQTSAGELIVLLADGSDPRQNWAQALLLKVLLPNLLLVLAAAFSVNWAVRRALKPLIELKEAVEHRSPRDLSALDTSSSPEEVRPLVESLNRLFALVNAQAESQRRFIADAAHQLRTPLAGLQAQVEAWAQAVNSPVGQPGRAANAPTAPQTAAAHTLQNDEGNKPFAGVSIDKFAIKLGATEINRLRNATRRTSQLANQLLALSRADAQSASSQPMQQVDLVELCANVLSAQLDAASAKRIDLGLDAQPALATGHEWLLRELLTNLTDNAIKYTPEGGSVTIRCGYGSGLSGARDAAGERAGPAPRAAFIELLDDGPGIPEAERAKALHRFYRVQGTQGEGNGLGLAIADEIARVHGSQLQLGDALPAGPGLQPARGLRITLVFPS